MRSRFNSTERRQLSSGYSHTSTYKIRQSLHHPAASRKGQRSYIVSFQSQEQGEVGRVDSFRRRSHPIIGSQNAVAVARQ